MIKEDRYEIILHIGLHKTATTYLQHFIFPNIEGVDFNKSRLSLSNLNTKCTKILLSDEGMSGCPYLINEIDYFDQFKINVNQLLNIFKYPKIIICIREPSSFIGSCYKQYLHEGGTLEWEDFFSLEKDSKIKVDNLFFSKYVNYLIEKLPLESLFIYDFETFKKSSEIVIDEMTKFITGESYSGEIVRSRKSNSGVPLSLEKYLIKLNKYFGKKLTLRVFGKVISQRTILQTLLPRLFNFNKKRDLTPIKKHFELDYTNTKNMISQINPGLYKKINVQRVTQ